MKINLVVNSDVGKTGYGLRVSPILNEIINRGFSSTIFCRSYYHKYNEKFKIIKPLPFSKLITYGLEGYKIFVSEKSPLINKSSQFLKNSFDLFGSFKLNKAEILHSWEDTPLIFKKAKEKGTIIFKESPMGNSYGQAKMFPDLNLNPYISPNEKKCLKLADYFFAPSKACFESLKIYGIPKEKIILCPFFADTKMFFKLNNFKNDSKKFIIIFVGVIRERKDIGTLLEAVRQINSKNIEVWLCGRLHYTSKFVVDKYSKLINLKLLGFVPHNQLLKLYNRADLFVLPSFCEGSAKVTYEAMACELPIITTFNAGSVARDGIDGFIIPPKNVELLKEKILFFYNNPEKLRKMGSSARSRVEEFNYDNYGKRVVDAYQKALENF